jgi:hypothetical protein
MLTAVQKETATTVAQWNLPTVGQSTGATCTTLASMILAIMTRTEDRRGWIPRSTGRYTARISYNVT